MVDLLNADPIGQLGGGDTNLFRYVFDNPIVAADPVGLRSLGKDLFRASAFGYFAAAGAQAYGSLDALAFGGAVLAGKVGLLAAGLPLAAVNNSFWAGYYGTKATMDIIKALTGWDPSTALGDAAARHFFGSGYSPTPKVPPPSSPAAPPSATPPFPPNAMPPIPPGSPPPTCPVPPTPPAPQPPTSPPPLPPPLSSPPPYLWLPSMWLASAAPAGSGGQGSPTTGSYAA